MGWTSIWSYVDLQPINLIQLSIRCHCLKCHFGKRYWCAQVSFGHINRIWLLKSHSAFVILWYCEMGWVILTEYSVVRIYWCPVMHCNSVSGNRKFNLVWKLTNWYYTIYSPLWYVYVLYMLGCSCTIIVMAKASCGSVYTVWFH